MDYQKEQIEASVIVRFIYQFAAFEKIVKNIFSTTVAQSDYRSLLYYFYGALQGSKGYINYVGHTWAKPELGRYKKTEKFTGFTLIQMIKIDQQEHLVPNFNFALQSENTPMLEFPFHDACIKLVNMRNKIAHETDELDFTDEDVVETMPLSKIVAEQCEYLHGFDLNKMSNNAIQVYSNLHTLDRLLTIIEEKQNVDDA